MSEQTTAAPKPLTTGSHKAPSRELLMLRDPEVLDCCAMERAYVMAAIDAGWDIDSILAKWSTEVPGSSAVIRNACIRCNDRTGSGPVGDTRRARVFTRELLRAVIGTAGSAALERRRAWALVDWSVRVATPEIVALTSFSAWSDTLRALPPIDGFDAYAQSRAVVQGYCNQAWAARSTVWAQLRAKYAAEAVAVAEVAAEAVAEVAVARAAAEAAEVAEVAVAGAAGAAAEAAEAAVFTPEMFAAAAAAARGARIAGLSWSSQIAAARPFFQAAIEADAGGRRAKLVAVRDKLDDAFREKLLEICAWRDVP